MTEQEREHEERLHSVLDDAARGVEPSSDWSDVLRRASMPKVWKRRVLGVGLVAAVSLGVVVFASTRPSDDQDLATGDPGAPSSTSGPPTSTLAPSAPGSLDEPPDVRVRGGGVELSLPPFSWCWVGPTSDACRTVPQPTDVDQFLDVDELVVEFPVAGWDFVASFAQFGVQCGPRQNTELEHVGETLHRLVPLGHAGDYAVTLHGRGPEGDVTTGFRWQTTAEGVLATPTATADIVFQDGDRLDSFGVEVSISDLAPIVTDMTAEATVTSAAGASHSFPLSRVDENCPAGSVALFAPLADGLAAAQLGDLPLTYEIVLEIDGVSHVGTGEFPTDVDPICTPCVLLTFDPPLPGPT